MQHIDFAPKVNRPYTAYIWPAPGETTHWEPRKRAPWACKGVPDNGYYRKPKCPARQRLSKWLSEYSKREKCIVRGRLLRAQGGRAALMDRLRAAFGSQCQYCGAVEGAVYRNTIVRMSIDRIVAGGDYSPGNVTLACGQCNNSKHDKPLLQRVRSLADAEAGS